MKKTSYISALLLAASALLLASCAKELGGNGNENYLSFSSNIAEIVKVKSGAGVQADTDSPARFVTLSSADGNKSLQMELSVEPNTSGLCGSDYAGTKAALQTEANSFYAMGYNGTQRWFPNSSTPQQVTVGQTYHDYKWPEGTSYNFFAYANVPESAIAEASITKDGVSLNYKAMPTDAAAQYDILLGRYSGIGKDAGTAEMTFYHPMTAVIFKVGDLDASITAVKSISIDGVYASGSTTLASGDGTPTFSWTPGSDVKTVSQAINSLPGEGALIGVPFVLIPQNLATKNVTVNLTVTTADGDILLTTTLDSGSWDAGKTYTYKVNYSTVIGPKPNEIWYWTKNEQPIFKSLLADANDVNVFGANMVSSKYTPGDKGIMKFDGPITKIGDYAFGTKVEAGPSYFEGTNILNLTKIAFPEGVIELGNHILDHANHNMDLEEIIIPRSVTTIQWFQGTFAHTFADITVGYINGITYTGSDNNYIIILTLGNGQTGEVRSQCFLKGTLITLADGSKKKVEDISYDDELLVWNFDKGCYDKAKILWLTKDGLKSDFYYKCTFSDGTVLNIVGNRQTGHRLFNATDLSFDHCNEIDAGKEIFTQHGKVKLVSCELIDSVEVEYVNLITDQHINCFANEVLASARYNNRWPIDQDMKFVKDDRKIRPYREFRKAGISRQWYDGMRLGEQQDSIARVKAYIDRCELNGNLNPDWKEPGFFARIWNWIKGMFS